MDDENPTIRPFSDHDEPAVIGVWHRSGQAAYSFLSSWQTLTLEDAGEVFREIIRPRCEIWVGTRGKRVVAFLAMNRSYIDRMYVDPAQWREGWGTRFVLFAKKLFPDGLRLHTHQENHAARKLYEKHGFKIVKLGVSPPPESAPDVEYHWRPDQKKTSWAEHPVDLDNTLRLEREPDSGARAGRYATQAHGQSHF